MNNHSFDDLIRQKATGHEAPVLPGTWETIAEKKKKRKRYPLFWWITGIALLIAGTLAIVYQNSFSKKNEVLAVESKLHSKNTEASSTAKSEGRPGENKEISSTEYTRSESTDNSDKTNSTSSILTQTEKISDNETVASSASVIKAGDSRNVKKKKQAIEPAELLSSTRRDIASETTDTKPLQSGYYQKAIRTKKPVSDDATDNEQKLLVSNNLTPTEKKSLASDSYLSLNYNSHSRIVKPATRILLKENIDFAAIDTVTAAGADSILRAGLAMINTSISPTAGNGYKPFKKSTWAIDISVMPFLPVQSEQSLLYLTRTTTGTMQQSTFKTDKIVTRLQPSVAYTILLHKKISPRLRIGAGLQYAMIKEKVDLTGKEIRHTFTEVERLDNGGSSPQLIKDTVESVSSGTLSIDALNSYRFFSVPLSLQYRLMEKSQWSLHLNSGLLVNVSADYKNSIQGELIRVSSQGIHKARQANAIGVDIFAGLRMSRAMHSFQVFAEPVLRYNLRRYDLTNMINRKFLHQAGLSFGVSYKFNQ